MSRSNGKRRGAKKASPDELLRKVLRLARERILSEEPDDLALAVIALDDYIHKNDLGGGELPLRWLPDLELFRVPSLTHPGERPA